jgi:cold shock CspA family protein
MRAPLGARILVMRIEVGETSDEGRPMRGTMLWFNEVKDHGFILTEEGERLYADGAAFAAGPPVGACAGIAVAFELSADEGVRRAEGVGVVQKEEPRRARRRYAGRPRA